MNPVFFGCAVLCCVCAVFAPPLSNLLFVWVAYKYFKMSAE